MIRANGKNGFTLAELLVATTVTLLVAGATVGVLRSTAAARTHVDRQRTAQQTARIAMNAIASALRNAYRGGGDQSVLEGIDLFQGKTPADRLRFFTTSNLIIRPGEPESDVKECEFFVGAPGAGELPALMRRLDPTRNKKPDEGGVVDVIAPNVLGLDFAYHDGVQWLSDWPEDSHGWPLAVRVRLVVLVGDEATYESAMATVPWDSAEVMTAWPISRVVNFPHWPKAGAAQPSQGGNDRNTTTQ